MKGSSELNSIDLLLAQLDPAKTLLMNLTASSNQSLDE